MLEAGQDGQDSRQHSCMEQERAAAPTAGGSRQSSPVLPPPLLGTQPSIGRVWGRGALSDRGCASAMLTPRAPRALPKSHLDPGTGNHGIVKAGQYP